MTTTARADMTPSELATNNEIVRCLVDEFDELDASIKDRLKLLGAGDVTVAGEFLIEGRKNKADAVYYFIRKAGQ